MVVIVSVVIGYCKRVFACMQVERNGFYFLEIDCFILLCCYFLICGVGIVVVGCFGKFFCKVAFSVALEFWLCFVFTKFFYDIVIIDEVL